MEIILQINKKIHEVPDFSDRSKPAMYWSFDMKVHEVGEWSARDILLPVLSPSPSASMFNEHFSLSICCFQNK